MNRVSGNSPWSCDVDKQKEYMCLVLIIRKILKWSLQLKDHHSPHNLFHLQPFFFFFFYFSSVFLPLPPSSVITNSFFSLCNVNRGSDGILVCMVDEDMVKLVCKLFLCHLLAVLLKCSPSRKLEQPPFFWFDMENPICMLRKS